MSVNSVWNIVWIKNVATVLIFEAAWQNLYFHNNFFPRNIVLEVIWMGHFDFCFWVIKLDSLVTIYDATHSSACSRLALTRETFLIQNLRTQLLPQITIIAPAYLRTTDIHTCCRQKCKEEGTNKNDIWTDFYFTDAMTSCNQKNVFFYNNNNFWWWQQWHIKLHAIKFLENSVERPSTHDSSMLAHELNFITEVWCL